MFQEGLDEGSESSVVIIVPVIVVIRWGVHDSSSATELPCLLFRLINRERRPSLPKSTRVSTVPVEARVL